MSVILGGGLSGLSVAYYLIKKNPTSKVTILEATNRVGGWLKSVKHENFIFEQGPRTIRPKGDAGKNTLKLLEELNLTNKIIPIKSTHPAAKNRMIYANGKLHLLPSNLISIFKKQSPFSKPLIYYILNEAFMKKLEKNDESMYDFVERRFGKDIADYAISPLICGICAGDAKEISVKFLMKSLFEGEQKYGSIAKYIFKNMFKKEKKHTNFDNELSKKAQLEKWSVYSFDGGIEVLPKTLEQYLIDKKTDIQLDSPCKEIIFENKLANIKYDSKEIQASHVFSTLLPKNFARLIKNQHKELANMLEQIPAVTVAVVNLKYSKKYDGLDAFGFLVPPCENLPILGVIFDSCCFNSDSTLLTVMMGGKWFEKYFGIQTREEQFIDVANKYIKAILKINEPPEIYKVNVLRDCIPQYVIGHFDKIDSINNYILKNKLPLSFCGSAVNGVGVNDVILTAKNSVDLL